MNLIDIYIQEVKRRLPEKNREDIGLELRSTIHDMLPDEYSDDDVKIALDKMGHPAALANAYRDRPMYLIGPRYYDVYVTILKMILPIAIIIGLITLYTSFFVGYDGEKDLISIIVSTIVEGVTSTIGVAFQIVFWVTLVFAIMERTDRSNTDEPLSAGLKKWTVDDLKHVPVIPKRKAISKVDVFASLLWTAIWGTVYFYAHHLIGIYEGGESGLQFITPIFDQEVLLQYSPLIVIVIGLEIVLAIYKLLKQQWNKTTAILNTVTEAFAAIVFIIILLNPNLILQDFTTYITDKFPMDAEQITVWGPGWVIAIIIIYCVYDIFDGFRKAYLR